MNVKTTLAGIGSILAAVGFALKAIFDNDPTTNVDIGATIAAVTAGIGLIAAKDAKPTGPKLPEPTEPKA
jgi:hypothetical protein